MDFRNRRRLIFKLVDLSSIAFRFIIVFSCFLFLVLISYRIRVKPSSVGSSHLAFPELQIQSQLLLPDSLLILLELEFNHEINCIYPNNLSHPPISSEQYDQFRWILRCPLSPANNSSPVALRWHHGEILINGSGTQPSMIPMWDSVVYEAVVDSGVVVVFVKGLKLRRDKKFDAKQLRCRFELGINITITTTAISAAQEIVRCPLPQQINQEIKKNGKVKVAITKPKSDEQIPSIARLYEENHQLRNNYTYNLCGCTMMWNQAHALREWVMYHAQLGVQRWFIYDNNSEDELKNEIEKLNSKGFNLTRQSWPWIKSQEAGFSHCVLRVKRECNWIAFFDIDEFYYFPPKNHTRIIANSSISNGLNSLGSLVENYSNNSNLGEIRTKCHSFGPSGLSSQPLHGVMVGYTCRQNESERHKSIIRPEAIDDTLGNVIHHFRLKQGFTSRNVPESSVLINHYKYQVWDVFKSKFSRRVSTYVSDWKDDRRKGSKDRAPGLGKEAVKPSDWERWFCEVWDTGLRDLVVANLADRDSGLLPWESYL